MSARSSGSAIIKRMMDYLQVGERMAKKTTFDHAMHLSHSRIHPEDLHYKKDTKELTYRFKVDPSLCVLGKQERRSISLGTYVSLMDSLTTLALTTASSDIRPGVSVQLQAEFSGPSAAYALPSHVDITSKVTKLGRNLAFIRADVRSVDTGNLLCFGSHVKYLPSGSVLTDMAFSSWAWPLARSYIMKTKTAPMESGGDSLRQVILPHLVQTATGRATFDVKAAHTNPFGGLHGGCQSILMELVGETLAKAELNTENVVLEAMQIIYQSTGKKQVEMVAETISIDPTSVFMRVLILHANDGRPVSEGTLRWKGGPQSNL